MYRLTAKGKEALDLTITMLPGIKKLKIDADFSRYYKSIRDAYSVSAEYLPKSNIAIFTAREDDKNLIKLELSINSEESAKKMVRTWNKKADKLYIDILNVFSNYYEEVLNERSEDDTKKNDELEKINGDKIKQYISDNEKENENENKKENEEKLNVDGKEAEKIEIKEGIKSENETFTIKIEEDENKS